MGIHFAIYVITNWERRHFATRFLKEMNKKTDLKKSSLVVVENGDSHGKNLREYLRLTSRVADFFFHKMDKRRGLATVWNNCMSSGISQDVVICNDDCVPCDRWMQDLVAIVSKVPHDMILMSQPNGFSAFYLHKTMWLKEGGFRDEFPAGYYEDDDWFLRVALNNGLTRQEVMDQKILSCADTLGRGLFEHKPLDSSLGVGLSKWDKSANKKVFAKYWAETAPNSPGAIENKGGKWYVPINRLAQKRL